MEVILKVWQAASPCWDLRECHGGPSVLLPHHRPKLFEGPAQEKGTGYLTERPHKGRVLQSNIAEAVRARLAFYPVEW